MEGTIRRLHCRYRITPGLGSLAPTAVNLDRLVHEQGLTAWAEALEQALGNDETVYVLRNVHARAAVNTAGADPGQRWGNQMARAVIQNIAHDPADGENLMRFDNQAHYVAAFITDLLCGIAWRQWYYGAFTALKDLELPASLDRVLHEHVDLMAVILKYLQDEGMLNLFLQKLDKDTRAWAWSCALGRSPGREGEELLISAALQLVGSLDMAEARLPDAQTILQAFLSSNPQPVD